MKTVLMALGGFALLMLPPTGAGGGTDDGYQLREGRRLEVGRAARGPFTLQGGCRQASSGGSYRVTSVEAGAGCCLCQGFLFADGFESGNTQSWSQTQNIGPEATAATAPESPPTHPNPEGLER